MLGLKFSLAYPQSDCAGRGSLRVDNILEHVGLGISLSQVLNRTRGSRWNFLMPFCYKPDISSGWLCTRPNRPLTKQKITSSLS